MGVGMRTATVTDFDLSQDGGTLTTEFTKGANGQLFDAEEMQAIREQYEERLEAEIAKREELEWQVRMALAQVRDAELEARRAADQMHKIHATLQGLLGAKPAAQPVAPARPAPVLGVAPVVAAKIAPVVPSPDKNARPTTPPPIPLAAKNERGPLPPRPLNGYKRVIA
jgi:hypothetical protein